MLLTIRVSPFSAGDRQTAPRGKKSTELTLPLCQSVKWQDGKPFTASDSSFQAQLVPSFGTIDFKLFCGTSCLYSTRLLKTPIIGRLTATVDSSSSDMLAGLSKCGTFRMPPCFWANAASPADPTTNSVPRTASA